MTLLKLFNETKMSGSQESSSNGHEQQTFHNLFEDVPRIVPFLCNRSHKNQSFWWKSNTSALPKADRLFSPCLFPENSSVITLGFNRITISWTQAELGCIKLWLNHMTVATYSITSYLFLKCTEILMQPTTTIQGVRDIVLSMKQNIQAVKCQFYCIHWMPVQNTYMLDFRKLFCFHQHNYKEILTLGKTFSCSFFPTVEQCRITASNRSIATALGKLSWLQNSHTNTQGLKYQTDQHQTKTHTGLAKFICSRLALQLTVRHTPRAGGVTWGHVKFSVKCKSCVKLFLSNSQP